MVFHRGRLRQNIRRDGCCRGGSAAGISVYIILFIKSVRAGALGS
nr:MAG TPA: hypothetical protein [Bacteriophage sp.]